MRKLKVGDVVIVNKISEEAIRKEAYLRDWIERNPLRVAKVINTTGGMTTPYLILIHSYTGHGLCCKKSELTLVGGDE